MCPNVTEDDKNENLALCFEKKSCLTIYADQETFIGILTIINMINITSKNLKARKICIFQHFNIFQSHIKSSSVFYTFESFIGWIWQEC